MSTTSCVNTTIVMVMSRAGIEASRNKRSPESISIFKRLENWETSYAFGPDINNSR